MCYIPDLNNPGSMEIVFWIVLLGLLFDYTNGFHDTASVVSTVIASKVLRPAIAITLAATLNTLGATQTSKVVETITTGLINPANSSEILILSALLGAIIWNILTAQLGLPSSASYALIGGLVGSALFHIGSSTIIWSGLIWKVIIPMVICPLLGFFIAFTIMKAMYRYVPESKRNAPLFKHLQVLSAGLVALSHGFNDAQKSMAVITLGLFSTGIIAAPQIPGWVIISCALVMGLGTATGGMRIVHTVGFKLTKIEPLQGFVAETSSSLLILCASGLGMPLSSTQMIVGSVTGVGSAKKLGAVKWLIAHKLVITWILTMPAAGLFASLAYYIVNKFI
jgi:inorganic phosphate transporter, PiT family